ncbi:sialidase family protein [Desulfoluna butyratoxydans]|uniref:Sialidases n=1 Tax=Desulfoluna butyratoxydans TaxID=231438 RepID=A0A4U8YSM6_9BACT|nr:sialidase family protein [Desulfoluna butyratoxydans]VFQ47386.1 sialidases [Desulfoluna butyratoxydans]
MPYMLMITGIFFSVLSIFSFALGWEMWRDSLQNGSIIGIVEVNDPNVKLSVIHSLKLTELDGNLVDSEVPGEDGRFVFSKIHPGQYLLNIEGQFISSPKKAVNVFPHRDSDIGEISCSLNGNENWKVLFQHSQISSAIITDDGQIWAGGFRTDKQSHNSYVLFRSNHERDKWNEVVIPEINDAERVSFLHQFESGEMCLGTNGKGAVISRDDGLSWEKLKLGYDISSINYISELPGSKWLIVARRFDVKYGKTPQDKPQCVIFVSNDKGKIWNSISEINYNANAFLRHSSGRIVIGTESIYGDASIFFSEDGGATWINSKMPKDSILYGVDCFLETHNGDLLAGTLDGKSRKNTHLNGRQFLKGGRIFLSRDGGKEWEILAGEESWGNVGGILQLEESSFLSAEGGNLIWSNNNGSTWFPFGKSSSCWVNGIIEYDSKILIIGNSALAESSKEGLIINYIKK